MKKLHAILFVLGLVCLVCLVRAFGIRELARELSLFGWGLAPFILLEFAAEGIHTLGWRCCLSTLHRGLPCIRLFRIRMAGYAINYLTPTAALGGEFTKAAMLASYGDRAQAVSGVLLDKVCAAVGQLLFVAAGSLFVAWSVTMPRTVWVAMFLSGGLVGTGIATFFVLQKRGKLGALVRRLAARPSAGPALKKLAREVNTVDEALKIFHRERPWDLVQAVSWHLAGYALGMVQAWCFFVLLRQPISAAGALGVCVLGTWFDLLTFAVPLNLGTLEGSRVVAFKAVGYSAVAGMTYGIALRLAQLCCAGFGLINYPLLTSPFGQRASLRSEPNGKAAKPREARLSTAGEIRKIVTGIL